MRPTDEFRIKYSGIFEKLDRYTPEQRAEVLWTAACEWCMGCGQRYEDCEDGAGDRKCCCGEPLTEVIVGFCPTCESYHHATQRAVTPEGATPDERSGR